MHKNFLALNNVRAVIGESLRWNKHNNCLYWIDTQQPLLFCYNDKTKKSLSYKLPAPMSCIDIDPNGDVRGIMSNALVKFGFVNAKAEIDLIKTNLIDDDAVAFNDGLLDAKGNFWVGTMDKTGQNPKGKLLRISLLGEISIFDEGFITSNGMGWSPDKTKFYFTDSMTRTVYQYSFDKKTCQIAQREIFIQFSEEQGYPDGVHVDSKGNIWIAGWASFHVYQYAPQGELMGGVKLPAKNITSCCFGGNDLKTLFVTSANFDLSDINDVGEGAGSVFRSNAEEAIF